MQIKQQWKFYVKELILKQWNNYNKKDVVSRKNILQLLTSNIAAIQKHTSNKFLKIIEINDIFHMKSSQFVKKMFLSILVNPGSPDWIL